MSLSKQHLCESLCACRLTGGADDGNCDDDDPVDGDHLNDHDDDQLMTMSSTCVGLCVCVGSQVVPTTAQHLPPPLSVSPEPEPPRVAYESVYCPPLSRGALMSLWGRLYTKV